MRSSLPVGIIGYGYLPLMNFRSCPLRNEKGCGRCPGYGDVTDPRGNVFRAECLERMYSVLYNHVPLYVGDSRIPAVDFVTLWFTTESPEKISSVTGDFLSGAKPLFGRTRGLYQRELL